MVALVHGDSTQLSYDIHYAKHHDPAQLSPEEVSELARDTAKFIIEKISNYIDDWRSGVKYTYKFTLIATHGHFVDNKPKVEYIKTEKELDTTLLTEALKAKNGWDEDLPDRNSDGNKKISVYLQFQVLSSKHNIPIATESIRSDDNAIVSTWVNQS